jgi:hypothetical protein
MTTGWRAMQWFMSQLASAATEDDERGGGARHSHRDFYGGGGGSSSSSSPAYAGDPDTIWGMMIESITGNQLFSAFAGMAAIFLGISLLFYALTAVGKLVSWSFRFMWKVALTLIIILIVIGVSSLAMTLFANLYQQQQQQPQGKPETPSPVGSTKNAAFDRSEYVVVRMEDGTLQALPRWSEIGIRERMAERTEAQWSFLDHVLGLKSFENSGTGGFWTMVFGLSSDDTPHIAKSYLESQKSASISSVAWWGTKMVGQTALSLCAELGRTTLAGVRDYTVMAIGNGEYSNTDSGGDTGSSRDGT